ncbi:reverse transcriptase family protein [Pseudomonas syringae]|uniref:reverse transcriptase family protein n=1 Tax=Pseudomonas syringae group TaxID=136849 RepID=UPI0003FFB281|nr:reverse transcriptase family protein [Pseudomonas avellanae]
MKRWSPQSYLKAGHAAGIPEDVLQNAVKIAGQMLDGCPPIFSLKHLATLTGVPYPFLHRTIDRTYQTEAYTVFRLQKASVGHSPDRFRYICAPCPELLRAQRLINKYILSNLTPHHASYAYDGRNGVLEAASVHCQATWLIKLDLTNFFESILEPQVFKLFRSIGYQPLVAFELSRLCTRVRVRGNPDTKFWSGELSSSFPYKDSRIGHLPQGAATSPKIANLVMRSLDEKLYDLASKNELIYTRYADDLIFSSRQTFDRALASRHIRAVNQVLREEGYWLNRAKTKIVPPGTRKVVLGLLVDGPVPRLTKSYKKYVSDHLYYLSHPEVSAEAHAARRGFNSLQGLINHISGKIAYGISIEPLWGAEQGQRLRQICGRLLVDHVMFP